MIAGPVLRDGPSSNSTPVADDEILTDSFADYAFEHFESASCNSLLTLAMAGDFAHANPFVRQSLREEESMATWIGDHLPLVMRRHVSLYADGGSGTAKV